MNLESYGEGHLFFLFLRNKIGNSMRYGG